jgi:hypothetical protein
VSDADLPSPASEPAPAHSYVVTRWLFLRLLGVVYLIAFLSLLPQLSGLIGSNGILPAGWLLDAVREQLGPERYWLFPTLAWLNAGDAFLHLLAWGGALGALLLILDVAPAPLLILLWVFYLSLVTVGQNFLGFQWDSLLLETGFLAVFFAPWRLRPGLSRDTPPSTIVRWLLWFLLFRLMVGSAVVKLASGDPTWRNLTALSFHYQTQPLPTPLAWYLAQLPLWFHKLSAVVMFGVELIVPFFILAPRRWRHAAAAVLIAFQLLIALSGNYAFFNLLTVVLCLLLLDDAFLARFFPPRWREAARRSPPRSSSHARRGLALVLALLLAGVGLFQLVGPLVGARVPSWGLDVLVWLDAPRLVNRYGLFAVMTTTRPEIVIEGSNDGETWLPYEFNDKPGDVDRRPPWVAPYQPRLDWQMWFAALGPYQRSPWFYSLMLRLLQGSPPVLALLKTNPFPAAPPRYVRAVLYDYQFTRFDSPEPQAWWRRQYRGLYFPVTTLQSQGAGTRDSTD